MRKYLLFGLIISTLLFSRRDCLHYSVKDALGRYQRPEKDTFAISPSGHFYIHYDTIGSAAPDLTDRNENGIPDYIDEVGIIADSANHVLVDILEYTEEPFDGEGGYDIYIMSYGSGVYGYNLSESNGTSYMKIDNDYSNFDSNFNLSPIDIMRITVGHEYFHGIQWGYKDNLTNSEKYFYEMTSMWFEDVLVPDGNDYLDGWADPLLNKPTADFDKTGDGYELALFGHYLSSFIDEKGREDAKESTILREIWERYSQFPNSAYSAVKYVLLSEDYNYRISFIEVWVDFISRNFYNGLYVNMNNPYYYYIDQALVKPLEMYPVIIDSLFEFEKNLSDKRAGIHSLQMDARVLLEISHSTNDYFIRLAHISTSGNHSLFDTLQPYIRLYENDNLHFILGKKNISNVVQFKLNYYPTDSLPPLPPSNLEIRESYHNFQLTWEASPGPGDSLQYHVYQLEEMNAVKIGRTDTTYYNAEGDYIPEQIYHFYVSCENHIGESLPTDTMEKYYPVHIPAQPENIYVTPMQDSIRVIWRKSTGPGDSIFYQIYRNGEMLSSILDTTYLDTTVISNSIYKYTITVSNDEGESDKVESQSVFSWPEKSSVRENALVSVYPNPVTINSDLHLVYALRESTLQSNLHLYDVQGRKIFTHQLVFTSEGWHREEIGRLFPLTLSSGTYFLSLAPSHSKARAIKIALIR